MASDSDSDISDLPDGAADGQDLSDGDLIVEDLSDRGKTTLIMGEAISSLCKTNLTDQTYSQLKKIPFFKLIMLTLCSPLETHFLPFNLFSLI